MRPSTRPSRPARSTRPSGTGASPTIITPAYLAADTPWEQSGKSGDECLWAYGRSLICDAIHRDGSFLDVGCANGFLMESVERWAAVRGRRIEPYGLDISPELADLARSRLPAWSR